MNPTINQLLNRRSIRKFTGESVDESHLEAALKCALQSPTSINAQHVSIVVTHDKETIKKIAQICGGQPQVASADVFVTVLIDYNRPAAAMAMNDQQCVIQQSAEGIVAGVLDAGIVLSTFQTAIEAFGYGTTAIAGMRTKPDEMIRLLKLPKNTYPVVGTTIGVIDTSAGEAVKPRVNLDSFAMHETYDLEKVQQGAIEYDSQLRNWWDSKGLTQMDSYATATGNLYGMVYYPLVGKSFNNQGFFFEDDIVNK